MNCQSCDFKHFTTTPDHYLLRPLLHCKHKKIFQFSKIFLRPTSQCTSHASIPAASIFACAKTGCCAELCWSVYGAMTRLCAAMLYWPGVPPLRCVPGCQHGHGRHTQLQPRLHTVTSYTLLLLIIISFAYTTTVTVI